MTGLASLVDKSLITERESLDGTSRFSLLETLREFALAALAQTGELERARDSHARWIVSFTESADVASDTQETPVVLGWIDIEFDNIAAAIDWSLERANADLAVRLTSSLWSYWYLRGLYSQGRAWLEGALALSAPAPSEATTKALMSVAQLAHYQGDGHASARAIDTCLAILQVFDSPRMRGMALFFQGVALEDESHFEEAENRFAAALTELQRSGDKPLLGWTMAHIGITWLGRNDIEKAIACFETVRSDLDILHDSGLMATTSMCFGLAKCRLGEYPAASAALARALSLDAAAADREGIAMDIAGISVLAANIGRTNESVRLMGSAENQRTQIGLRPFAPPKATDFHRALGRSRLDLGEADVAREWAIGFSSSFEQRQDDIDVVLAAAKSWIAGSA